MHITTNKCQPETILNHIEESVCVSSLRKIKLTKVLRRQSSYALSIIACSVI